MKVAPVICLVLASAAGAAGAQSDPAAKLPPPAAGPPLQFSDQPDFAVAGIVDYTAAGGHGSDTVLRTSEDLARATIAPPGGAVGKEAPASAASAQQEASLRAALAAAPDSYAANRALGAFYLAAARYPEAVPVLERASALHRRGAEDEFALALACRGVGDAKEASRHVDYALGEQERADFHRLAGELRETLGDPVGAVEHERRATQLEPTETNYFAWGSELLLHRAVWQAAGVFERGVQLYPRSAQLKTAWAAALFAGAKYDEAAQQLCAASDLKPESPEPYRMMGRLLESSPAPAPCVDGHLARFLRLRPDDAEANYDAALSLLKQVPPQRAQAGTLLAKAQALDPKLAPASLELGILAAAAHRDADAIAEFKRAIAADPQLAEAHYRLGLLYDRAGRAADAHRELELHEALLKAQAEAVERRRREVKEFVVTLGPASPTP